MAHQMELCHSCIMQHLICMHITYLYIQMRVNRYLRDAPSNRRFSPSGKCLLIQKGERKLTSTVLILNKQKWLSGWLSTPTFVTFATPLLEGLFLVYEPAQSFIAPTCHSFISKLKSHKQMVLLFLPGFVSKLQSRVNVTLQKAEATAG